jgi:hypothetical protein
MRTTPTDRLAELMVEELERPLSDAEDAELRALIARHPDWSRDDLSRAAAAVAAAQTLPRMEAMPEALRARIAEAAEPFVTAEVHELPERSKARWLPGWIPWSVAAAAALAAVVGWARTPERIVVETKPPPVVEPSPAERLAALRTSSSNLIRWEASATEDPLAGRARGEFIWSPGRQEGFMVFEGLPPNDPDGRQYQLWIFDQTRKTEHPVDGGVFDVDRSDRVVIPIDPAIEVREPTLFAVTVEQPGGVVVSDREHIVVVGQPPKPL